MLRTLLLIVIYAAGIVFHTARDAACRNYYIDNTHKGPKNDGTIENPWNSVDQVNETTFLSGDSILLKRGGPLPYTKTSENPDRGPTQQTRHTFGVLSPKGSGTESAPIVLAAYGSGAPPHIDAAGDSVTAAVLLYNQDNWIIRDLEISNNATKESYRWGILVYFHSGGNRLYRNISIINNHVHDVFASFHRTAPPNMYCTGGIYVWVQAYPIKSFDPQTTKPGNRLHNVLIHGNRVENITGEGIFFRGESVWDNMAEALSWQTERVMNWNNLSTNVVIRKNVVIKTCDGIEYIGTDNALVEYNVVDSAGWNGVWKGGKDTVTGAVCAIWPTCTRGGIIQFNEVMHTRKLPGDGYAFNRDLVADDTLFIQYNYSHDNMGGFFMEVQPVPINDGPTVPATVIRYNISNNDGKGDNRFTSFTLFLQRGNNLFYNNVFYTSGAIQFVTLPDRGRSSFPNRFYNNIFYGTAGRWDVNRYIIAEYDYNCYWGGLSPPTPAEGRSVDAVKITANPLFAGPLRNDRSGVTADAFRLRPQSPCINAGKFINKMSVSSFWKSPLRGRVDIGADEVR